MKQQGNEEQRQSVTAHQEKLWPVTVKGNGVLKLETAGLASATLVQN